MTTTGAAQDPLRVLVVTTVHTPLDARIHHRQIRALLAAGDHVTYAAPLSAAGTDPSALAEGVTPVDLPRSVGRRRGAPLAAARRLLRTRGRDHDLVLLHDPELVAAVAGWRDRPPVVLDVHEDLAASLIDRPWIPEPLRPATSRFAAWLEARAETRLDGLLLAEPAYADRFARPHPVVPNVPWLPDDPPPAATTDTVVQIGRLSAGRGTAELIAVGAALRAVDGPTLHLIGTADADVRGQLEAAHARGDVVWHGFLPNEQALAHLRGAVAGLSLLHDLPNYRVSTPTKLLEYLAHRIPAVSTPLPAAVDRLDRAGGGVIVPFGGVDATVQAVLDLAADPDRARALGDAGRAHVAAEACWDVAGPAFVAELHRIARREGR